MMQPNDCDKIIIVDYDKNWVSQADAEKNNITQAIKDENFIAIEHIGSTSIPGAMAKPIIDFYLAVHSIVQAKKTYIGPLGALKYQYWSGNPNPNKMFFVKGMPPLGAARTHHIHVVAASSDYWRDRLAFRDYLRQHPEAVKAYNQLKVALAAQYTHDREAYTEAKNEFVVNILKKAGIKNGGQR